MAMKHALFLLVVLALVTGGSCQSEGESGFMSRILTYVTVYNVTSELVKDALGTT